MGELSSLGVPKVKRETLPVGDFIWQANGKSSTPTTSNSTSTNSTASLDSTAVVLDVIVERKRHDDLISSLTDGRWRDQRQRLLSTGASQVIYLVEGMPSGDQLSTAADSSAVFDTYGKDKVLGILTRLQLLHGISVHFSSGAKDTAAWLFRLDQWIRRKYSNREGSNGNSKGGNPRNMTIPRNIPYLDAIPQGIASFADYLAMHRPITTSTRQSLSNHSAYSSDAYSSNAYTMDANALPLPIHQSWNLFCSNSGKNANLTVSSLFAIQMASIKGITQESAIAIARKYGTLANLTQSLRQVITQGIDNEESIEERDNARQKTGQKTRQKTGENTAEKTREKGNETNSSIMVAVAMLRECGLSVMTAKNLISFLIPCS